MTIIKRRPSAISGLIAAVLLVSTAPAAHAAEAQSVAGAWQTVVPSAFTAYQPSPNDPTTGTYRGVGSSVWQGTWTGITHYTIEGTANLVTGAGSGTLTETFAGRSTSSGEGTITFAETYTLDAAGHLAITARIAAATDDFTGARGVVTFIGTETGAVTGSGTYRGHWSHSRASHA